MIEPNPQPSAANSGQAVQINYSIGKDIRDNQPHQVIAKDFENFKRQIAGLKRPREKHKTYICAAMEKRAHAGKPDRHPGERHFRQAVGALPCAFLAFDFDYKEAIEGDIIGLVTCYFSIIAPLSYLLYTTSSHAPQRPRFRLLLGLSREVSNDERDFISRRIVAEFGRDMGNGIYEASDSSVYKACQPIYTPTQGADVKEGDGGLVDADKYLEGYTPRQEAQGKNADTWGAGLAGQHEASLGDDEIIDLASKAKNGDKFKHLFYEGDVSKFNGDHSSADMALCGILAFYCLGTPENQAAQLIRLWKRSKLCRIKTDREDYADRTARKALEECAGRYSGDGNNSSASASDLEIFNAAGVSIRPVVWLWRGWLVAGALNILAGAPGTGKTTIALKLAAILSTGGEWPDKANAPLGDTLIWSGEDDMSTTLTPRLKAMGADLSKIHFIGDARDDNGKPRPFNPAEDIDRLAARLAQMPKVKLLIIDSVVSVVKGDSHKNAETRQSLTPLVALAERAGCAVLGITHFSKNTEGRSSLDRVTGSLAFGALARLVLATGKRPNTNQNVLAVAKSNLGVHRGGFVYSVEGAKLPHDDGELETSMVAFGEFIDKNADDIFKEEKQKPPGAIDEAKRFLLAALGDGPGPAKEVKAQAESAGIAEATLRRAKEALGVHHYQKDKNWFWELRGGEF
jgi:putative DNA primase/helicase